MTLRNSADSRSFLIFFANGVARGFLLVKTLILQSGFEATREFHGKFSKSKIVKYLE